MFGKKESREDRGRRDPLPMIVRRRSRRRSISRFSFPFATRLVSLRDPFFSPSPLALFPSLTFTIEPPGFVGKVHPFLPASVQPSSFVQREMRAESLFSSSSPLAPPPSVYTAFEKVKEKFRGRNLPGWKASFQTRAPI